MIKFLSLIGSTKFLIIGFVVTLISTNLWTHQATKTAEKNAYDAEKFYELNDSLLSKEKTEKALYIISEKYEKEKANIKIVYQSFKAKAAHHAKTLRNVKCFTDSQLRYINAAAHNRMPADPSKPTKSADHGSSGDHWMESRSRANNERKINAVLSELNSTFGSSKGSERTTEIIQELT